MSTAFIPRITSKNELLAIQSQGLRWTVKHAWEGSEFYREKLRESGVSPDDINDIEDITKLPFTTSADLQDGYPWPLKSVPFEDIVRIHASSGTTGKRKVMVYTQNDIDDWIEMFARCYEMAGLTRLDRVQICVGYGVWTAGAGFQMGCEKFGAMALPVGPGNIDMQLQFLVDFQPTVLCATSSMALLLAEEVEARGLKDSINLRTAIMGAERASESMRTKIKDMLGLEETFDIPGLTELYGPGIGLDCPCHNGIHYWADRYILEIIDPETLQPVKEGEIGEMVYTSLRKEAAPLIRYRSRDLTRMIPGECPCGCTMPRHDRIMGRSDDMFIIRGVNVYPSHLDEILSRHDDIGSEYQVEIDRKADGKDYMTLRVERSANLDSAEDERIIKTIEKQIREGLLVRSTVEMVDYQSLPRTVRKSKRIFDNRD